MKNLCMLALSVLLLAGCSTENTEPLPYEIALQACNYKPTGATILTTKHTGAYATVKKIVFRDSFRNTESISFYVVIEGYNEYYNTCNLPEMLKVDEQKIKFNGMTSIDTDPLVDPIPVLELTGVKLIK